ncbi:AAA family ATPase [Hyphomicrobium sp. CS1BSMeth3]|uniref:AAA family ATPase n=1 Tax=Hyphomicrobium sp. CS1BSMeth3 TaxID=1892844 RepID=UPI0009309B8C|nr:AAA family ATPase [Hyphomicrobium sp. CS1BSMeth3]
MLETILIAGRATYSADGQSLGPCREINFIFGSNGSGKTTISRVIADPASCPASALTWVNGQEMERLVYNSDFVERNFTSTLKGIFTLGAESAETLAKIDAAKAKQQEEEAEVRRLEGTLKGPDGSTGKEGDLRALRGRFEDACWEIKNRHDAHFREAFEGFRNAKARFCDKILAEHSSNQAALCDLDDLKARAGAVFQKGLARQARVVIPDFGDLLGLEQTAVLSKTVIGKSDVNVSALIARLGNSDWVKQGRAFLDRSGDVCPFCQQKLLTDLTRDLNDYFDETYAADMAAIDRLQSAYESYSSTLLRRLKDIAAAGNAFIDSEALHADIDRLEQRIELNKRQIDRKKKEPSATIALEGLAEIADSIVARMKETNARIDQHNSLVDNIAAERARLVAEAWYYVVDESNAVIAAYLEGKTNLDKAITGISKAIETRRAKLAGIKSDIAELERAITSVEPTVKEINGILSSFGFTSFKLATAGEQRNLYKLVRQDGSDALKTLSEGEKSFIAFLYFYHLIRGSVSASGTTGDRIVVFDDPVSSLDSDVLFIVSALIKRVLEDTCAGRGQVKQVFVLTHNIYFHKEVSFDPKRGQACRTHETFWIVRKQNDASILTTYNYNPIKTSYELLWSEVRNANRSTLTIQNTLRRILESYFKLLGNMDRDEIVAKFGGQEKQICGSLFSWVNDGSHATHDDLYVSADASIVDRYLDVFQKIFEKTGHIGHYEMMIGSVPGQAVALAPTAEPPVDP